MSYQVVGMRGDIPFTVTSEALERAMKERRCWDEIQFLEYLYDETGRQVVGIRGRADLGHGYGFDRGWKEFTLKVGETYSFTHGYTSIDGPTDWRDGSFTVTLRLAEE